MPQQYSLIKTFLEENDTSIISHLYKLKTFDSLINIRLFASNNNILLDNNLYTILPIQESKYIYDSVFVWDLLSLELVLDFPNLNQIYYLQLDPAPWIDHYYMPYKTWKNIFDNPKVTVITNNEDTQKIISSTWNNKTKYLEGLNLKVIYEEILQSK